MSSFLDNDKLDWHDSTRDYVLKKEKMKSLYNISGRKERFNWENLEGEFNDEYDEFDIGISKMSHKITANDEHFIDYQNKINQGERSNWRDDLPFDLAKMMGIGDEYLDDDDDYEED